MGTTLKSSVTLRGVGLHGGQSVTMTVAPASHGTAIRFVRTDVPASGAVLLARYDMVSDTQLCTRLTNASGVSVGTVEHIMAALAGLGITDAQLTLDGPEVPIMDGSALPFVDALSDAGVLRGAEPLQAIRILDTVHVSDGDKEAMLSPAPVFEMDYRIDFTDPAIGVQTYELALTNGAFIGELSDCRTFGHLHEVEHLRSLGLARGGNLQNAIVVDRGRILNPEGLRRSDEFVRHKMLDAVGDLALAGAPIIGRYSGVKSGHGMTNRLLHELFARPDAWTWDELAPARAMGGPSALAPRREQEGAALAV